MPGDNTGPWPLIEAERKVAENEFATVYLDDVRFGDGSTGTHLRIDELNGGVVVAVINQNGQIYMHDLYRYSADAYCLEVIRGYIEPGESDEDAALRELREELPFLIKDIKKPEFLGHLRPNSTILTARTPVFRVEVEIGELNPRETHGEDVRGSHWYSLAEFQQALRNGGIEDGYAVAAFALLMASEDYGTV